MTCRLVPIAGLVAFFSLVLFSAPSVAEDVTSTVLPTGWIPSGTGHHNQYKSTWCDGWAEGCTHVGVDIWGNANDDIYRISEGFSQSHLHCDEDWVFFQPIAGATYEIETSNMLGGGDTVLELFRDCTTFLDSDDDGGDVPASKITYTATADDDFLDVRITQYIGDYDPDEGYDISVTCVAACDSCSAPTDLFLTFVTVSSVTDYDACNSITAGPDYTIQAPGDVTLTAGSSIALGNGFVVEAGAKFTAELDPFMN